MANAQADLGLAWLMQGKESEGWGQLHRAQTTFRRQHDTLGLVQCLNNELAYFQKRENARGSNEVELKLAELRNVTKDR